MVYRLSRSKAPKTQQICHYRHMRKTSELFLLFNTGVDFSLRNNFANSGSFAKVFVSVYNYNSLVWKLLIVGVVLLFFYKSITPTAICNLVNLGVPSSLAELAGISHTCLVIILSPTSFMEQHGCWLHWLLIPFHLVLSNTLWL